MAAPKRWGYSRQDPIRDELLVSWADGDLTEILAKEVEERLLLRPDERTRVAAFARSVEDASTPHDGGRDRIEMPRAGLVQRCKALIESPYPPLPSAEIPGTRRMAFPRPPFATVLAAATATLVTLAIVAWMIRNL